MLTVINSFVNDNRTMDFVGCYGSVGWITLHPIRYLKKNPQIKEAQMKNRYLSLFCLSILIILLSACQSTIKPMVPPPTGVDSVDIDTTKAPSRKRVALVIGNGDYRFAPLRNPENDAKDMADALRKLGFKPVIYLENAGREKMDKAVEDFSKELGKGTVGLFYFSGHGVQFDNKNYLIPADMPKLSVSNVKYRSISADYVLTAMEEVKNTMNIIILDACRDNPFESPYKNLKRGLAGMMDTPTGSLIAYATSPGKVAADGVGRNSPYTKAILEFITKKGLPIEMMFKRVRNSVRIQTRGKQTPWESSSLQGKDFYFVAGRDNAEEKARLAEIERLRREVEAAKQKAEAERQARLEAERQAEEVKREEKPKKHLIKTVESNQGKVFKDRLKDGDLGPEMVWIPAGAFQMGDIQGRGDSDEKPVHSVSVKRFAIGRYEVTFAEYNRFAKATGRKSKGKEHDNRPVINVSWDEAVAYTKWLSQQTGKQYRLPSEAEWEYAARAGTDTKYWWGDEWESDKANCSTSETKPVASFAPNPFGLYDTVGNVSEWIADPWHGNYKDAPNDGSVWKNGGTFHVLRGGSKFNNPNQCRCAYRFKLSRHSKDDNIGFRVALDGTVWSSNSPAKKIKLSESELAEF
jgi:formylglycine-generating enzyme required for sulfatase activity